mmetsp:Transcript_24420/g.63007  ORF Transcript_24420/g.63007 Transcript_24420/m.63007 type:complete len:206 (+) Transcript_24420:2381-2998(+)
MSGTPVVLHWGGGRGLPAFFGNHFMQSASSPGETASRDVFSTNCGPKELCSASSPLPAHTPPDANLVTLMTVVGGPAASSPPTLPPPLLLLKPELPLLLLLLLLLLVLLVLLVCLLPLLLPSCMRRAGEGATAASCAIISQGAAVITAAWAEAVAAGFAAIVRAWMLAGMASGGAGTSCAAGCRWGLMAITSRRGSLLPFLLGGG